MSQGRNIYLRGKQEVFIMITINLTKNLLTNKRIKIMGVQNIRAPWILKTKTMVLALSVSIICMQVSISVPVSTTSTKSVKKNSPIPDNIEPLDKEIASKKPERVKTVDVLQAALEAAYQNNTEIKELQTQVRSTDERLPQALAGWKPTIYANASIGLEKDIFSGDKKESGDGGQGFPISGQNSSTIKADVTLNQNLFNGGKTIYTTCQAESLVQKARASLADKEQSILLATVQAYFGVIAKTAELNYRKSNVLALNKTLEATRDKFNVGEETRTSIAQAEADLEAGQAEQDVTEAQLLTAMASFERITGARPGNLKKPVDLAYIPRTLKEAIEVAQKNNPAIMAAIFQEKADRNAIKIKDADLLPKVDLQGSVGRTGANTRYIYSSNLAGQSYKSYDFTTAQSVSLNLRVPLVDTNLRSISRQSREDAEQSRIAIETKRREIIDKLVEVWETYLSAKANVKSYEAQVKANEVSLEGTRQETLVGSKIVLDVLNAQRALVNSQLNLVRAEQNYYQAAYAVLAGMGKLNGFDMKLKVKRYDPKVHYQDVRNSW